MPTPDSHQLVLVHRLERVLLAFFLLALLFLCVVYAAAPSLYTNTPLLKPSPSDRYPLAATLLLVGIVVWIAVVIVGIVQQWRWLFWLLLVAFGCMLFEIPATILQLTGVVPRLFPLWYSLCRMGVAMIAVAIAVWMSRSIDTMVCGLWAGKPHPMRTPVMERYPRQKEIKRRITRGVPLP